MTINPIHSKLTATQARNLTAARSLSDTYNALLISQNAQLPARIHEQENKSDVNRLLPVAVVSLGVMGAIAAITGFVKHNTKILDKLAPEERVTDFTRNLAVNDETHQAVVRMVISPGKRTMLAGAGVLVLSAMAFMGKTFAEGLKDVWLKRREADIQKNQQERLIDIETQSFGGKIQIIRNMLSEKSKELSTHLVPFTGKQETTKNDKSSIAYIAFGIGTLGAIVGLGFLALKNLRGGNVHLEQMAEKIKGAPTVAAPEALGGSGIAKPSFYSHVDDYRAFFYNLLLNTDNKQFKQMFFGITGLTALGYGGKLAGEAVRDVEVKKMNADTEIDLQNRLVSTDLRNFKAKKDAAIQPLTEEFYRQAANGKPKEELKVMADNILLEIKNGPPFVYN